VLLGPTHGVDFGLLDLGETGVAVATDPISILPALGFERAGRFALHIVLSDVAVSGSRPTHLAVSLALPESTTSEQFDGLWGAIDAECRKLGISIVTGHTAQYPGAAYPWVGAATAMGVCDPETVVRPDGAQPGDRLLVTRGPAVETSGLFASLYPAALGERGLDPETVATAADRLEEVRLVRDAVAAAEAGDVSAMHDATEGGLLGAFCEMASSADVRFEITPDDVPVRPGVEAVCDALAVDPWKVTTSGTLVLAVPPAAEAAVRAALAARGTPVGHAGEVVEGSGVDFRGETWREPPRDPSWDAYASLASDE
jgi:hydrogenase maturation factor